MLSPCPRLTGLALFVLAMAGPVVVSGQSFRQTQIDDYTRYELEAPGSQSFRIIYDVTATTAGAPRFFNAIRPGSEPTVHSVTDLMDGGQLQWLIVDGSTAKRNGHENARPDGQYIQIELPRPVPAGGQVRVRIDKTYRDPASYTTDGGVITFKRTLGIKRNAVVLPLGYELLGVSYPTQVVVEDDGRLKVSFMNRGPAGVPLLVRARPLPAGVRTTGEDRVTDAPPSPNGPGVGPDRSVARVDYRFSERAFQDRDIVYFLQQPETHSFRLYHDYTETRPGMDRYVNVVRAGSKASNPSAILLDTGEPLKVETLRGEEVTARGVDIGGPVTPETEVVVIWYDSVQPGHSARLRIEETYTDAHRYLLYGDELVWDRGFGRPRNTVILPEGWFLTANSVPAVIDQTDDGRVRLRYVNDRPGNIDVFIKARRR